MLWDRGFWQKQSLWEKVIYKAKASSLGNLSWFNWDRVNFLLDSWCSALFWIQSENGVESTQMSVAKLILNEGLYSVLIME